MRVLYYSDIHDEIHKNYRIPGIPPSHEFDLIVLAGDITSGQKIKEFVVDLHLATSRPILFVLGNHEFLGKDLYEFPRALEAELKQWPDIHLLCNSHISIDDTLFYGCTLWTTFELSHVEMAETPWAKLSYSKPLSDYNRFDSMEESNYLIRDFEHILCRHQRLTPQVVAAVSEQQRARMRRLILAQGSNFKKLVAITHFPPTIKVADTRWEPSKLTAYFYNEIHDLAKELGVDYWFYGHNHHSVKKKVDNTIYLSNQVGYEGDFEHKIIEI